MEALFLQQKRPLLLSNPCSLSVVDNYCCFKNDSKDNSRQVLVNCDRLFSDNLLFMFLCRDSCVLFWSSLFLFHYVSKKDCLVLYQLRLESVSFI